ncbi:hypothetical protein [Candidatus Xianfuyuplasma coldseepsis]|uniref:Uncharacterized protein n=1 Tax=Candidatus Xianfuyuplasma coldseepsis TaxID=2782163 RepID=A0A7L7KRC7_9MOLU|nr:hypothetical protein [Xianfuyuplasma coldseepsis]QMS85135.1 hypothetical protein G4Z02_05045 [Xianfuyuplasma coldseepsis]
MSKIRIAIITYMSIGIVVITGLIFFHDDITSQMTQFLDVATNDNSENNGTTLSIDEGEILLLDDDSPINGFSIKIPENSYSKEVSFSITTEPFTDVTPVDGFEAITPLITVDNDHTIAEEPLDVSIPIDINTEEEFAMAFFYDPESDTYEAIPTISLSNTEIVIQTIHFSSVVVSKISMSDLFEEIFYNPSFYDSGFVPSVDGWHFSNYGSKVAPFGQCAGTVMSSIWYYSERKVAQDKDALYGLYDNDTPTFWTDDQAPYRFAGVIQESMDWEYNDEFWDKWIAVEDDTVFLSFVYALKVTQRPQYIGIFEVDDNKKYISGHALSVHKIAYNVNQYELSIYDPNFPADDNRIIAYTEDGGFKDYSSGATTTAALENGTAYNEFIFYGEYALINKDVIATEYEKMVDSPETYADDVFTDLTYEYLEAIVDGEEVWTEIEDFTIDYIPFTAPDLEEDEIYIRFTGEFYNVGIVPYFYGDPITTNNKIYLRGETDTYRYIKFGLEDTQTTLGFKEMVKYTIKEENKPDSIIYSYNAFRKLEINQIDLDTYLNGDYQEIERGSGFNEKLPSLQLIIDDYSYSKCTLFNENELSEYMYQSCYMKINNTVDAYGVTTPTLTFELDRLDPPIYDVVFDDTTITLTNQIDASDYIIFERTTLERTYLIGYRTYRDWDNYDDSTFEIITGNELDLDSDWVCQTNPNYCTYQRTSGLEIHFMIRSNDPYYNLRIIDFPQYGGYDEHHYFEMKDEMYIDHEESITLTFEFYHIVDDEEVIAYSQTITFTGYFDYTEGE